MAVLSTFHKQSKQSKKSQEKQSVEIGNQANPSYFLLSLNSFIVAAHAKGAVGGFTPIGYSNDSQALDPDRLSRD